MKRITFSLLLGILLVAVIVAPVLAGYYANLTVTEANGNAYTQVGLIEDVDIDYLADNGYISSTGLDTRVTSGGTAIPHMLVDDSLMFVTDVEAYGSLNLLFETGETALSGFPVIVGDGGYVTISDHANLELGDDFEVEFDGYLNVEPVWGPVVAASATSTEDTEVTSHDVDLPSGIGVGDLLIMFFCIHDDEGGDPVITWDTGWTELDQRTRIGSSNHRIGAAYRVATGGEGSTATVTTGSDDGWSAHQVFRITDYTGIPVDSAYTFGSSDSPNSGSLASGLTLVPEQNVLWFTMFGGASTDTSVSSYPTNYDDDQTFTESSAGVASLGSATRTTETTTENPGAFTLADSIAWCAWTIAIEGNTPSLIYKEDSVLLCFDEDEDFHAYLLAPNYYYYEESEWEDDWMTGYSLGTGSQSKESDHLYLYASDSGDAERTYVTSAVVDLTDIDTLWVDWENTGVASGDNESHLVVDELQSSASTVFDARLRNLNTFARQSDSLDVSGISGNRYIRVHARDNDAFNPDTSELKVYKVWAEITDLELIEADMTNGEYKVEFYSDGTTLSLDIDDSTEDSASFSRYGVADNANDWAIGELPYYDYYTHTTSDTLRITYEPDSIIVGTTLPNEESPGTYNGAITWGSNPGGVTVTLGGLVSDEQLLPAGSGADFPEPQDIAGPSGQPGITADVGTLTTNPLYPIVSVISDTTSLPVGIVWVMGATFILALLFVWMIGSHQMMHQIFLSLAGGGWVAFCWHLGIYPFWVIFIYAVLAIAIVIGERSPTIS